MSAPATVEAPHAAYHRNGHDTEIAAALSIASLTGSLRRQVLGLLRNAPFGLTDDEGGALMGRDRLAFGRRRHELVQGGWAKKSIERRLTPGGRNAIVWVITNAGRDAYESVTP